MKLNSKLLLRSISVIALFVLSACGPSEEELQAIKKQQIEKIYLDNFNREVITSDASKKWIKNLNINRKNNLGAIYISEIHKEWVDVSPIAFVGNIIEVENYTNKDYIIKIKLSPINSKIFMKNNLILQLGCDKKLVDKAISESRDNFKDRLGAGASVGVIADIAKISRFFVDNSKYEEEENPLIGIGACLSIVAIPQKYSSFFLDK